MYRFTRAYAEIMKRNPLAYTRVIQPQFIAWMRDPKRQEYELDVIVQLMLEYCLFDY